MSLVTIFVGYSSNGNFDSGSHQCIDPRSFRLIFLCDITLGASDSRVGIKTIRPIGKIVHSKFDLNSTIRNG